MYASSYSASSSSPYTSPASSTIDPYRASPIPVAPKQPYNSAFSPPPQPPNGFQPMPSSQSQRYQQQPQQYSPQQYARAAGPGTSRYASPVPQYANGSSYAQQPLPRPPQHAALPPKHKGTLAPGQMVRVGDQTVRIERYLSEGGYAHVYLTTSDKPIYPPTKGDKKGRWGEKGYTEHCLKRIAFEDDSVWIDVKKEIEVMKSLPPNPHLVQYLGSAHSRLPTGGHEVFILMEFCAGGGIIDLLNKRLRDRLKEIEILNIFTDVCETFTASGFKGSFCRCLPLVQADSGSQIENVLSQAIQGPATPQRPTPLVFKLCDFGSTTFPADKPPTTKIEADALAMDLNRHTTLQYRSPEMVEPMLGLPVGLPSDVWALGCLLYKLCYYTTPFEEHGPLAIVNAKYTFPPVPAYSPRIQHLIASMLVEQPIRRPTVFEILTVAHDMSGTKPEIDYPAPSRSLPPPPQQKDQAKPSSQSSNLLDFTSSSSLDQTPSLQPTLASTIQPQRRGRPTRESSQKQVTPAPAFSSAVASPQPQPLSMSQGAPLPNPPRLQITGEIPKSKPSTAPGSSLDAFGMPTMSSSSGKTERGFGDSFAAPAPKPSNFVGSSRFGANLPRPPSGFGESFGGGRSPASITSSLSKSPLNIPSNRIPASSASPADKAAAASATKTTSDPSSSMPDGELSFETRFPSIEVLSADDTITSPSSETLKPEHLISPISMPPADRPPFQAKLSMMGNMTGGDLSSPNQSMSRNPGGPPQPRSTHVTGTAFKESQGGVKSPSPTQSTTNYFDHLQAEERPAESPSMSTAPSAKSPMPQDLMTGDDQSELQLPAMQPGRSVSPGIANMQVRTPASASAQPVPTPSSVSSQPPQATGHSRPLLPHIDSSKPSSNIMSDQWSPLEQLKRNDMTSSQPQVSRAEDSSDDDAGPENASGPKGRPVSSINQDQTAAIPSSSKTWRQSNLERSSSTSQHRSDGVSAASASKSVTVGVPPSARTAGAGQGGRSRPQSMFATPSSSSINTIASASLQSMTEEPASMSNSFSRPTHARKGSITDIVSRYETMKPPSHGVDDLRGIAAGSEGATGPTSASSRTTNGLARKPSVASKPQALRKPTLDQPKHSASEPTPQHPTVSPTEPTKLKIASKPAVVAPKPVRYGDGPKAEGYSRSSSGRAFPISKPKPAGTTAGSGAVPSGNVHNDKDQSAERAGGGGSVPASPEKQQSVNSLIARWNQGQTANASAREAKPQRGGYI